MQYLEDKYPHNPLLPHDIYKRAINFQVQLHPISPKMKLTIILFFLSNIQGKGCQSDHICIQSDSLFLILSCFIKLGSFITK